MSWGNHKRPLSTRQQKFVEHYLITGVASQAAIRAGYSPASAWSAGSRLKRDRRVANAIRIGRANEARRAQITHERVLTELARVAFSDIGEILDWESDEDITLRPRLEISPHDRAAIAELAPRRYGKGPRIKLHNKARALEALARHLGVYDKTVPAVPPPYTRRDGRDTRAILVERLTRLAREPEESTDSLDAGASLGVPVSENPVVMPGHDVTNESAPPSSSFPSPRIGGELAAGEHATRHVQPSVQGTLGMAARGPAESGKVRGAANSRSTPDPPSPGRTFPPGFPLPPK